MPDQVVVLIPVNRLDRAKGRLAEILSPEERRRLFLATLNATVAAAARAGTAVAILTADAEVERSFLGSATILQEDPARSGLNAQLEYALESLVPPPEAVLILHADLPLVTDGSLRRLIASAPPGPSVTLVRSRDGGTNAMLLRPPGHFPLAYGPGSFERHREAAASAGLPVIVVGDPALELDLDTPADLEALLSEPGGAESSAGRVIVSLQAFRRERPT